MTDKERYGFDVEKEMRHLKGIVEKNESLTISNRFTRYLIEQAERAQKLEEIKNNAINQIYVTQERNERLENRVQVLEEQLQGLHKMYDIRLAKSDEFEEQNKRYQEGIKLAMRKTDCDNTWDFLGRLLEGKEETDLPYRIGYKGEAE